MSTCGFQSFNCALSSLLSFEYGRTQMSSPSRLSRKPLASSSTSSRTGSIGSTRPPRRRTYRWSESENGNIIVLHGARSCVRRGGGGDIPPESTRTLEHPADLLDGRQYAALDR